jgi:hypothetical protein
MINSKWIILRASVPGKNHVENNIPCQDHHAIVFLDESTGIACLADGAGSCSNAHIGSELAVSFAIEQFLSLYNDYPVKDILLNSWPELATESVFVVYERLKAYSISEEIEFHSLSSTLIVLLFSPNFLLCCHIGDGRAGYLNDTGVWQSCMTPFKGDQVGQTVFLTSLDVFKHDDIINTNAITGSIKAFTLLTDGGERSSWLVYQYDEEKGIYYDPNIPFPGFYDKITQSVLEAKRKGVSDESLNEDWKKFLATGTEMIENETDDKTMILGVLN